MTEIPYRTTSFGERYIPGFTSFNTSYLNELAYTYNIKSNRIIGSTHELPYRIENINVNTNEYVTINTINPKIELLYKNYIYLLTRCSVAKADAIASYRGPILVTDEIYTRSLTGVYKTDYTQYLDKHLLDRNILQTATVVRLASSTLKNVIVLAAIVDNSIQLYQLYQTDRTQTNCELRMISNGLYDSLVDSTSDLLFENLVDIAIKDGVMFVLDGGTNIIYRYNIRGATTNDRVLLSKKTAGRLLTGKLGGHGAVSDSIKFKSAVCIVYENDQLYVVDYDKDTNQTWLKVYDINLNHVAKFNLSLDFQTRKIINLCVHDSGTIYILTDVGDVVQFKLSELIIGNYAPYQVDRLSNVDRELLQEESYIDIQLSTFNTNTIYVLTNKTLYKKYIDQIKKDVGNIEWSRLNICSGDVTPVNFSITPHHNLIGDSIVLLVDDNNSVKRSRMLLNCVDQENQITFLSPGWESQIYMLEDVKINPDEYVSAFVYNKMLYKMYFNLQLIVNNLQYVSSTEVNILGEKLYPGVRYIARDETDQYNMQPGIEDSVGVNELLSSTLINRCFSRLYDKQQEVLQLVQDRDNTADFLNNITVHFKRYPVKHTQQKLPSQVTYKTTKL